MVKVGKLRIMELLEPNFFGGVLNHNIVIIEKGPNGGLMMIDTGLPGYLEEISKFLRSWNFHIEDISDIVITHWHPDHAGNASIIKKISKAKVYAHFKELPKIKYPENISLDYNKVKEELNVSKEDFENTMKRIKEIKYEPVDIDFTLKGGEMLGEFKVIHVPGHTEGHIALYDGYNLIAGDAIRGINGASPPLKFFSWNYELALESFNKLINRRSKIIVPFHGELIFY
ncbi:MAG: MBL fold metallo-hydrolase [Saccharolobus sp.]